MRLTLFHKGLILVSIPLCFEITIFGILISLQNQAEAEAQRVGRNKEINDDVNSILRQAMFLGRSKSRTFNSAVFNDHANQVIVLSHDLETLTRDTPDLHREVESCRASMKEAEKQLHWMQYLIRNGSSPIAPEIIEARGKLYDAFQGAISSGFLNLAEKSSEGADDVYSRELRERIKLLLQGALGVSVLMGIFGATMFSKHLVGRLENLKVNATNLANGQPLLPLDKGDDEVTELDKSFHTAAAAIIEATRMRQEATAMITHDLKTPLQSIRSFLEMLQHGMLAELNDKGKDMMVRSEKETVKMVGLIDSVLQLEKMRSGSLKLKFVKTHLGELLDESVEAVESIANEKEVLLKCEYSGLENELIEVDASWIGQVLVNVLIKSIKFSPKKMSVIVVLQSTPNEIIINVSDQGSGISLEEQKLLFEKFHQISVEGSNPAGSGLGLAISKQVVELHHGSIEVSSARHTGCRFVIKLPRVQTATAAHQF
jgi:signal transduction histidine kinase